MKTVEKSGAEGSENREARPELDRLDRVRSCPMYWIWRPYLPEGMLAMLSGDPGAGKTYAALAIAAALTTGMAPGRTEGDHAGGAETRVEPVDVLYLSVENSWERILRPRFDRLGGDAQRFHLLSGARLADGDGKWVRARLSDSEVLRKAIQETGARLLIVDPLQSFLEGELNRARETRPVMDGLCELAEEHNCGILLIRHLNKAKSGRALARGVGSIDLTAAVRSEMLVGCSPLNPAERALVQVKSNVAEVGPALGYAIAEDGSFQWTGPSELNAAALLSGETGKVESKTALEEAEDFLRQELNGYQRSVKQIMENAKIMKISERTLLRAKAKLGVVAQKEAGLYGAWHWKAKS